LKTRLIKWKNWGPSNIKHLRTITHKFRVFDGKTSTSKSLSVIIRFFNDVRQVYQMGILTTSQGWVGYRYFTQEEYLTTMSNGCVLNGSPVVTLRLCCLSEINLGCQDLLPGVHKAYVDFAKGISMVIFDQNSIPEKYLEYLNYSDFETQWCKAELGDKFVAASSMDVVKAGIGEFVGYMEKNYLMTIDGLPGFSGSPVSNGNNFVGVVAGEYVEYYDNGQKFKTFTHVVSWEELKEFIGKLDNPIGNSLSTFEVPVYFAI